MLFHPGEQATRRDFRRQDQPQLHAAMSPLPPRRRGVKLRTLVEPQHGTTNFGILSFALEAGSP
jgi:hypothetical protein